MRWTGIALLLVLLSACAGSARALPIVVGPVALEPRALLDRALAASREAGYASTAVDDVHGTYVLRARAADPLVPVYFVVQCYRDGWVRVIPAGPGAARTHDAIILSPAVRSEHLAHGVALSRSLRGDAEAASADAEGGADPDGATATTGAR